MTVTACSQCGHFSCICVTAKNHGSRCGFRLAMTLSIGIACKHGYDVCKECDPCTCKNPAAQKEFQDFVQRVSAKKVDYGPDK